MESIAGTHVSAATGQSLPCGPAASRVDVAVAIVFDASATQILIARRPRGPLRNYWEFPGGKRRPDESIEAALHRELLEETGLQVDILQALPFIQHDYPHVLVRLFPHVCRAQAAHAASLEGQEIRWISPDQLTDFSFLPANASLIHQIISEHQSWLKPKS